ncbi:MAG: NUDIX hydrolase [Oscillospiraceae bacterium]|nr:NUDIX hydrolase [Oscillospiraceae bacterium]
MNRAELTEQIRNYRPDNEQEAADREVILSFLDENEDAFERENRIAHMTASAWVVNGERTKVLMVYHRIYDSWSWTGGHADGETDLLAVAVREVREETGIKKVIPVSEDIFSLETLTVDGHEKRGNYVPSHLHLNLTYLLEADETEPLTVCEDENKGVAWFTLDEALKASTEPWFVERIYAKLNEKLKILVAS